MQAGNYTDECSFSGILVNRTMTIIGGMKSNSVGSSDYAAGRSTVVAGGGGSTVIDCSPHGGRAINFKPARSNSSSSIDSSSSHERGVDTRATLSLTNISFHNGHTEDTSGQDVTPVSSGGAAVHVGSNGSLQVNGCHFKNQTTGGIQARDGAFYVRGGGAIFVDLALGTGDFVEIKGSTFDSCNNTAAKVAGNSNHHPFGGAVCIRLQGAAEGGASVGGEARVGVGGGTGAGGAGTAGVTASTGAASAAISAAAGAATASEDRPGRIRVRIVSTTFSHCHSDGVGGGLAVGFEGGEAADSDFVFDRCY
jgi:hypothetical protein